MAETSTIEEAIIDALSVFPTGFRPEIYSPTSAYPLIVALGVLSPAECAAVVAAGEAHGFAEAKHAATAGYALRDNGRIEIQSGLIAETLWPRMKSIAPAKCEGKTACGLNPRIRLYKYQPGQRFGKHVDESDDLGNGEVTLYTVLFYLSGCEASSPDSLFTNRTAAFSSRSSSRSSSNKRQSKKQKRTARQSSKITDPPSAAAEAEVAGDPAATLEGGETAFYEDHDDCQPALVYVPTKGSVLLHGHGDQCMTHEGAPVLSGVKYLLRTDVVYS